ncbi:MAG: hypothetical protein M3R66_01355 [Actinomycetota bacterium]|nr:hypothetical protein [Actinomycetota bacterium]
MLDQLAGSLAAPDGEWDAGFVEQDVEQGGFAGEVAGGGGGQPAAVVEADVSVAVAEGVDGSDHSGESALSTSAARASLTATTTGWTPNIVLLLTPLR